ncbi:protein REDUCED CHLOROPLAST COVERAGE 1-like isoform X2 [Miscanthus floridulus]|uniref:protein REDUCED CHLOROPLAST COVERAGE 1-like isoform X2 n=1 Tax=Miscanthus floridulus TaxID=154761 RepID=UPI003458DE39
MLERRWWWASRRWRTSTGCSTACPPPPLLDIVACTTTFPKPRDGANKHKSSKQGRPMTSSSPPAPASTGAHVSGSSDKGAPPISEVHDMAASLLVEFYYYSLTHLTSPVDFIRRKEASGAAYEGDYFKIEGHGPVDEFPYMDLPQHFNPYKAFSSTVTSNLVLLLKQF